MFDGISADQHHTDSNQGAGPAVAGASESHDSRVVCSGLRLASLRPCAHRLRWRHPSFETRSATVGASYKAVIKIPHGCDGSPTTRVRVLIPEGVIGVKPKPMPGWSIETKRGPYARSYKFYHGAMLTEGVKEIVWSGKLPDDYFDEFVFAGFLTDSLAAGTTLHFPVYQECEKGSHAWTDMPAPGQDAHALKSPAPGIALLPVADKKAAAQSFKIGTLVIEAPWARATPGGAQVGGGYMKITNTGKEADRLIGGSLPIAGEVEVHEMAMAGDVMKMRRLADGLEIKPGADRGAEARRQSSDVHGTARRPEGRAGDQGHARVPEGGNRRGGISRGAHRRAIGRWRRAATRITEWRVPERGANPSPSPRASD